MKHLTVKTVALLTVLVLTFLLCAPVARAEGKKEIQLRFHETGQFKIMVMSDFQDYVNEEKKSANEKSIQLMNRAIAQEKPDLVVMNGDQIGGDMDGHQLQEYIKQMVTPLEDHQVPWLITFGNHDEDAEKALEEGWDKIRQLDYYMSFEHNVNQPSMSGVEGHSGHSKNTIAVGDMYKLIYDAAGQTPLFNVWALDSNRYDWSDTQLGGYDWIKFEQILWYYNTSKELEAKFGKLNALMFFHIPLPEWALMSANALRYDVQGHKFEDECPSKLNSGLFSAVLSRGDVRGIFAGHDHVNDYMGKYMGITLGYDANVGFQTYGLGGEVNDSLRGVRIINLDASDLSSFESHMLYATELGMK